MGNQCASARESFAEKKQATGVYLSDKYTVSKLKASGYAINNFKDNGETKEITAFENSLPICKVALDDFERRIRDF